MRTALSSLLIAAFALAGCPNKEEAAPPLSDAAEQAKLDATLDAEIAKKREEMAAPANPGEAPGEPTPGTAPVDPTMAQPGTPPADPPPPAAPTP